MGENLGSCYIRRWHGLSYLVDILRGLIVLRPKILTGPTVKKITGCGNIFVTINRDPENERPIEVITRLGKSGGCTKCQHEALTRTITLGLKYGVPLKDFADELQHLKCPSPNMFPRDERTLSCADALASALKESMDDIPST